MNTQLIGIASNGRFDFSSSKHRVLSTQQSLIYEKVSRLRDRKINVNMPKEIGVLDDDRKH